MVGPFAVGDPDINPVVTQQAMLIPNRYAVPLLAAGMTPKQAHDVLTAMIAQDGTSPHMAQSRHDSMWTKSTITHVHGLAPPSFMQLANQLAFLRYRLDILHQDFPHLAPGCHTIVRY